MKYVKRILYLLYYCKHSSLHTLLRFWRHAEKSSKQNGLWLLLDCVYSVFRYNISLLEYFQFGFYQKPHQQRLQWAGTGFMYEYQRLMNPPSQRTILDNKTLFFKAYAPFVQHVVADTENLKTNAALFGQLKNSRSGKLVLKTASGKCGRGVEIKRIQDFATAQALCDYMNQNGFSVAEEYIIQHDRLQALSPSAVNTVRIFTQLDAANRVHILGCRQRISVNTPVDNMAAGNLAAPVDPHSGIIWGPGVYSDVTKAPETIHPVTGVSIIGFQVPFWNEAIQLVKAAALWQPQNRSIGWDVVITNEGPGLIEGNHDWCKLVLQLPDQTGRRRQLEQFQKEYTNSINNDVPTMVEAVV